VGLGLREGAILSVIGIAAGVLLAIPASGLLQHLLYGVDARDVTVLAAAAAGLTAVAAAGYLIPAARASRADPIQTLRGE
jgi:ABC-type antimicrobial peptide transport system permease subunit